MTRPLTPFIRARWRHSVMYYQTELGLREWGESIEPVEWLRMHGYVLAPRDPYLIVGTGEQTGSLQITTPYEKLEDATTAASLHVQAFTGTLTNELFSEVCDFLTTHMELAK